MDHPASQLVGLALLILWVGIWWLGGWLLVSGAFRLRRGEGLLVGAAAGLLVETWLANLLAQWIGLPAAFWLAAAATLLLGLGLAWPLPRALGPIARLHIPWFSLAAFGLLTLAFTAIGRGLALFDDYQNLPLTSLLAAGDIPPHFALDPTVNFGYHYFTTLAAAQIARISGLFPTTALDIARALTIALTLVLAGGFARRLTGSRLAGVLSAGLVALIAGARWVLLFAPRPLMALLDARVPMMGSGAQSGEKLFLAMLRPWLVEGAGPITFPFAFGSGVNPPVVMAHAGRGAIDFVVLLVLLLTVQQWRGWRGWLATFIFVAALGLTSEIWYVYLGLAVALLGLGWAVSRRSLRLPKPLWSWIALVAAAAIPVIFQGGVITEVVRGMAARLSGAAAAGQGYFANQFFLFWPPGVISAHLGRLSFTDPIQLLAAVAEVGPIFLVFPLLVAWSVKLIRLERWGEAALLVVAGLSAAAVFMEYSGTAGISATLRLYEPFLEVCKVLALPLLWMWLRRRGDGWRITAAGLALIGVLGGTVYLGIEMVAVPQPVYSTFVGPLDARIAARYWDRLEPGALVFDPVPSRAPTLLARPTDSSLTWYKEKPEWKALVASPDPTLLRAAGFTYLYYDRAYWDRLTEEGRTMLAAPCIHTLERIEDSEGGFRVLADVSACR